MFLTNCTWQIQAGLHNHLQVKGPACYDTPVPQAAVKAGFGSSLPKSGHWAMGPALGGSTVPSNLRGFVGYQALAGKSMFGKLSDGLSASWCVLSASGNKS